MAEPDPLQYDRFARDFEAHMEIGPFNALYDRPATLDLMGDVAGKHVFDAGCGPGLYLQALQARGATKMTGCDSSPAMVDLAKERIGGAADLRAHSLEEPLTWLADSTIDAAVCALVYHHVNDRVGFLREMHRTLTPNGSLTLSTQHPTTDWMRHGGSYFQVNTQVETWSRGWEVTIWRMPLTVLSEEFASAGFSIERIVEPQPVPEMEAHHPDTFAELSTSPAFIIFRLVKARN